MAYITEVKVEVKREDSIKGTTVESLSVFLSEKPEEQVIQMRDLFRSALREALGEDKYYYLTIVQED